MSLNKKLQLKPNFDLLINDFKNELANRSFVNRPLHHFTNKNGLPLNWIRVQKCHHEHNRYRCSNEYTVFFHKDRKKGDFNEIDSEDEDDLSDYVFSSRASDSDLKKAINKSLLNADKWDRCSECSVYSNSIVNHKCTSCILNTKIIEETPQNEKFECIICKIEKLNIHKRKLKCNHDRFCEHCIKKLEKNECPLCREIFI